MTTAAKALFENVRTEHNVMTATPRPLSKRMTVLRTAMTQGMLGGMIPPNMGFRVIKGTDTQSGNSRSAQRLRSKIGHRNVGADGRWRQLNIVGIGGDHVPPKSISLKPARLLTRFPSSFPFA